MPLVLTGAAPRTPRVVGSGVRRRIGRSSVDQAFVVGSDDEFNAARAERGERLDAILDKISKHGYDHLSPEEKRFLFDESQR